LRKTKERRGKIIGKYPRAVSKKKGHGEENQKTKPKLNQSDNYHFEPSIFYMHNPNNFYPKRLFSNFAVVVIVAGAPMPHYLSLGAASSCSFPSLPPIYINFCHHPGQGSPWTPPTGSHLRTPSSTWRSCFVADLLTWSTFARGAWCV